MHDYAYRMNKINSYSDFKQEAKISQISYQFVNLIFGQMSNRSITNWVDIELLYYQNLIDTFVHNKSRIYIEIEVLNKDFLMIKKKVLIPTTFFK